MSLATNSVCASCGGIALPGKPAQFIVLAIDVVVAPLRPGEFVAAREHRNALRKEQGGKKISHLAATQAR